MLRYYTSETVENLRASIADHIDWYMRPTPPFPLAEPLGGIREARIPEPALADQLKINATNASETDVDNALVVYNALSRLTPHQAAIERMWVYLCHCDCPKYVASRWLNRNPSSREDAVRKIRNHFFAVGNRALIRDNAVSRLWWLGKIAHDVDPDDPRKFLTILLHRQDVRSALIERPSVSMNRRVLGGIYAVMAEHWENGRALFERETFRSWMVALNRRGGVVLLDALPKATLGRMLREEATSALAEHRAQD